MTSHDWHGTAAGLVHAEQLGVGTWWKIFGTLQALHGAGFAATEQAGSLLGQGQTTTKTVSLHEPQFLTADSQQAWK